MPPIYEKGPMSPLDRVDPREGSYEAKISAMMRDIKSAGSVQAENPDEEIKRIQSDIDSFSEIRPDLTHQLVRAAKEEGLPGGESLVSPYERRMIRTGPEDDATYETRVSTLIKAAINNCVRSKPEIDYPVLAEIATSYLNDAEQTQYSSANRMGNIENNLLQLEEEGIHVENEKLQANMSSILAQKLENKKLNS